MSPAELKKHNIAHFQKALGRTLSPDERATIEGLIDEERAKPASAYPADRSFKPQPWDRRP